MKVCFGKQRFLSLQIFANHSWNLQTFENSTHTSSGNEDRRKAGLNALPLASKYG
jgi:hypothetical protein